VDAPPAIEAKKHLLKAPLLPLAPELLLRTALGEAALADRLEVVAAEVGREPLREDDERALQFVPLVVACPQMSSSLFCERNHGSRVHS
jgi:hypothetical protein